ncbi:M20 family metallopeptidase [Liquorilactobacillus vini]|uniref:Probable succinyl-diaminopimelate desuccinylase n=1 Tax=Liquorilactobacillus vini DSM 20605 TaxID=1133569 RepID=A0A0R2CFB6_9LACO|nr:M20 family metallopeptidase [Liquorilactobacillus vini]KRM87035.1 hypothetical protein FD21_GL001417 [Liquorilactobacillus vini DSM 20605]
MNKEKLVELAEENKAELFQIFSDILKIPSTSDMLDTTEITKYIRNYLSKNNIESKTYEAKSKLYNIIAHIGSTNGKQLILCGHDDTVPVGDESKWEFPPFSGNIVDDYFQGRGASDMKGGVAGILFIFVLIHRYHLEPKNGGISLVIVPDEESSGKYGASWLLDQGLISGDGCIIAEPSGILNPTIGQKGSSWFKLTVHGVPGHGSLAPFSGKNAIIDMLKAVNSIRKITDLKIEVPDDVKKLVETSKKYVLERENPNVIPVFEKVTCNVGTIKGGTSSNVVADKCEATFDLRLPFGITYEEVMNYIRKSLDELKLNYEIENFGFYGSANYTPAESPICSDLVSNINYVTKDEAFGVLQWACSDARHFRLHNIPVLQYGPAELDTIHGFNEKVKTEFVDICAKAYLLTVFDFLD